MKGFDHGCHVCNFVQEVIDRADAPSPLDCAVRKPEPKSQAKKYGEDAADLAIVPTSSSSDNLKQLLNTPLEYHAMS